MSRVSTQPPQSGLQEQKPARCVPLSMDRDPSGFTERAPAIVSLLPDEALSTALARGDALAVHGALTARLAREPAGSLRDTLRELLAHRALFVVAESPPSLRSALGIGMKLVGLPSRDKQETPFIATRAACLFGFPVWPLGEHLVRRTREGQLEILGRVAAGARSHRSRWMGPLVLGSLALGLVGLAALPFVVRDVQLVNGLSRPVEVRLDERTVLLQPGEIAHEQFYSLGRPYQVETRWPGMAKPIDALSLNASQYSVYSVLGAASVRVGEPGYADDPDLLEGHTRSIESHQELHWQGGWERRLLDYTNVERWSDAAALAKAVFLADPSDPRAGEAAALILVQHQPDEAHAFALELFKLYPDHPVVGRIVQDVLLALGKRDEAFRLYDDLLQKNWGDLPKTLLAARVAPPEQQRQVYANALTRMPNAPELQRAVARIQLADGYAQNALRLLEIAALSSPESLEDLELRVRANLSVGKFSEATVAVQRFAAASLPPSWGLAVLAGRLARVAGPKNTHYVVSDLTPRSVTTSSEQMALFKLLTGTGTLSDEELNAVRDSAAREAIELTRTALQNLDKAAQQAVSTSDKALLRLDTETAALLALELSRRGVKDGADRLFRTSLSLMAARVALETYVHEGRVTPDFPMLPPGLQSAAYLERARVVPQGRFVEQTYARWTDVLGGMARRALDSGYGRPAPFETPPSEEEPPYKRDDSELIRMIKRSEPASPEESWTIPDPQKERDRVPRPWPAP